jgi:hypothetical protein
MCTPTVLLGMELEVIPKSKNSTNHSHNQTQKTKRYTIPYSLTNLPPEIVPHIFSYCRENRSLEESIKHFMRLRTVCKKLKQVITCKLIGELHKNYMQFHKDLTLNKVYSINRMRFYTLLLIHAGADVTLKDNYLLKKAMSENNPEFVKMLLDHNADPYMMINKTNPIFSHARTKKIAKVFMNNNVDVHKTWKSHGSIHNVLWHITTDEWFKYPSNLMGLYLTRGVNAKLCDKKGHCLLHQLALSYDRNNADELLEKGKLLLDAIPDMINTISKDGNTPLDVVQQMLKPLKKEKRFEKQCGALTQLFALYKERGGRTAQELKQNGGEKQNCNVQ